MTIQDVIDLMMEPGMQLISVYSLEKEQDIFHGDAIDIPGYIAEQEIASIDTVEGNKITFNVE